MNEMGCQRGCAEHVTRTVTVDLAHHGYDDYTQIPKRFAQKFDLDVWDTRITPVDGGPYCPARDCVSDAIVGSFCWEPLETTVLLCCFEQCPGGLFIDFGSQIGWYSTLAAISGLNVTAVDSDPACVTLTALNLERHRAMLALSGAHLEVLDEQTAPIDHAWNDQPVDVVAKIDVEGAEIHAIRKIRPLIDSGLVKYMLIEITPSFADYYPDLIWDLIQSGYSAYKMPDKQVPPVVIDQLADLRPYVVTGTKAKVRKTVASWSQENLLFVLGGI